VRVLLAVVLVIIGIVAIVVGVMYITEPLHSLPSFFPGYVKGSNYHHKTRGYAGVAFGAVVLIIGLVLGFSGRSRRYGSSRW
jgi:hypothetical protein